MIDDGISEHAIEPRDDALFVADIIPTLEGTHEGRLQNIFRNGPGFHALFEEGQELFVPIHQSLDCSWGQGIAGFLLNGHPLA